MQVVHEMELVYSGDEFRTEPPVVRTKFNISMEKKIERLWHESEQQGWSYSQFVSVVMEVLTVLHHRNKLQRAVRTPQKVPQRRRALS
jgi:hypothetical protein